VGRDLAAVLHRFLRFIREQHHDQSRLASIGELKTSKTIALAFSNEAAAFVEPHHNAERLSLRLRPWAWP